MRGNAEKQNYKAFMNGLKSLEKRCWLIKFISAMINISFLFFLFTSKPSLSNYFVTFFLILSIYAAWKIDLGLADTIFEAKESLHGWTRTSQLICFNKNEFRRILTHGFYCFQVLCLFLPYIVRRGG